MHKNEWVIVYGKYDGVEKYAVTEMYRLVEQELAAAMDYFYLYAVTIETAAIDAEAEVLKSRNVIFIGTPESNRYIARFAQEGVITPNTKKEGYTIKVCQSPFNPEKQMIILAGADANGTLYAVRDFEHYYNDHARYLGMKWFYKPFRPIFDKMPAYEVSSAPAIQNRGVWGWGTHIFDYKRYFDNMSKWKMNIAIWWVDSAPLNGKEIVEYAHSRGIKLIWGYSWCWGAEVDPTSEKDRDYWTERIIRDYEEQYAPTGCDGIYFQTFTETNELDMGGTPIAELATNWVNHIAGELLERNPEAWIQFGLHASSIKENYQMMAKVDPRINITWEDAEEIFPFNTENYLKEQEIKFQETGLTDGMVWEPEYPYEHQFTANDLPLVDEERQVRLFPGAYEYLSRISELRGKDEDFGYVFRSFTGRNWPQFDAGHFIMGEAHELLIAELAAVRRSYWRYHQAYWTKNLHYFVDLIKLIDGKDNECNTITNVMCDGLYEAHMWYPVALYAEALWDPYQDIERLKEKVSLARDVYFA